MSYAASPTRTGLLYSGNTNFQITATVTQSGKYSYTGVKLITVASSNAQPTNLAINRVGAAVFVGLLAGGL